MKTISGIQVEKDVLESIMEFSRTSYPKEFIALLEGEIKEGKIVVTGLLYQPYKATRSRTSMRMDLPIYSNSVGSVHSHPSGNNHPSRQDLSFFAKHGFLHMIIGYPFRQENIACYDASGKAVNCLLGN